jgi:hypothetical protein
MAGAGGPAIIAGIKRGYPIRLKSRKKYENDENLLDFVPIIS